MDKVGVLAGKYKSSANTDARSFYGWTQWRHKLPLRPRSRLALWGEKWPGHGARPLLWPVLL